MTRSGFTTPRALRAACLLALPLFAAVLPARAQPNIFFQSTPTTNSCQGWILWPGANCPPNMLGTQVLTCQLFQITGNTAGGVFNYAPAANAVFPPGWVCSFHDCAPAALQLTCMTFAFANSKAQIQDEVTVKLTPVTQQPKALVQDKSDR